MADRPAQISDVPVEFARLSRRERRDAVRKFDRWTKHYEQLRGAPLSPEDRARALNLSYISVAAGWLLMAYPCILVAAIFWGFHDSVWQISIASVFTIIVLILLTLTLLRRRQAHEFWAGNVDPRI
jgi:fatty acid desaturase